ncbi:hypothetical protein KAM338_20700 [Aeromonas caviae]|uniref:hypothetical protein n=1 Tax=Aeromonas TaxID=642 RepID=UPI000CADFA9E|nr:hypothetical protein [Aeromonas hydrophila]PKD26079.1 hypothetical protein AO056_00533 [Aeromonas hydrophila]BBG84328.1 hypothetical protein AHGSH82_014730 [Aeromonas hydrophila]BBT61650.1 hypothetical protein WP8S18E02_14470 [Aeromonas hydrophila]GKQ61893.1 hypothetical protein KAM338_20700 [Aeromonas caviae]
MPKVLINKVNKKKLNGKLDDFYFARLPMECDVIALHPEELDLSTRFDILIKVKALPLLLSNNNGIAVENYKKHIVVITEGKCSENGNLNKNSIDCFINDFREIAINIRDKGFNESQSYIPINEHLQPLNGAHRIASALHFNREIKCVIIPGESINYEEKYFSDVEFSKEYIESCYLLLQRYQRNIVTGVVWPSLGFLPEKVTSNVIYSKKLELSSTGLKNFVVNTYLNESWIGNAKNNFSSSVGKSNPCFGNQPLTIFMMHSKNIDLVHYKDSIRADLGLDKNSIHICDDSKDSYLLARFALNPNIENILNSIRTYIYDDYITMLLNLRKEIDCANTDYVLSGSALMGLLGLREPQDIDYISYQPIANIFEADFHGTHNGVHSLEQILSDSTKHFYYFDLPFMSPEEFMVFKNKRAEPKDLLDIELIKPYAKSSMSFFSKIRMRVKSNCYLIKVIIIANTKILLLRLGMFDFLKKILRR